MPGEFAENILLKLAGLKPVAGKLIPRPTPLILTWLAPQPVGVVPPEWYGLPENYFFGFTPEQVLAGVGATQTAEQRARIQEYGAQRHVERLAEIDAATNTANPVGAAYLEQLTDRLAALTADERAHPSLIQEFDLQEGARLAPQLAEVVRFRSERAAVAATFDRAEEVLSEERARLIAANSTRPPSLPNGFVFIDRFAAMHGPDP